MGTAKRILMIWALLAGAAGPGGRADAESAARTPPVFRSIDRYVESGGVKLAGGKKARPEDWRSIAIATTSDMQCTAALVGVQVVVTSAHCVDADPAAVKAQVMLGAVQFGTRSYPMAECAMHPDYAAAGPNGTFPRSGRDFALCRLRYAVDGIAPEVVSRDPLRSGDPVVLLGLGCQSLKIVNGKPVATPDPGVPVLRLGDQRISGTALALDGSGATLDRTTSDGSKPNICPGDSGGPVLIGVTADAPVKGRSIAGLNSAFHGQWGAISPTAIFYSYLAPTGSAFVEWAKAWSDARGLQICGIQLRAGLAGCRL